MRRMARIPPEVDPHNRNDERQQIEGEPCQREGRTTRRDWDVTNARGDGSR